MWEFVRADIHRMTHKEKGILAKLGSILFHPGLHAVLLYRLSRWLYLHHMPLLAPPIGYISAGLTGAQISPRATIGKGLAIYHPYGVVIGATAVIGENCTLVQGNVIGQLYGGGDRPTIGNNFTAGAGAKILGRIRIGDNVKIGPNALVVRSLPNGVTVAAEPARIALGPGAETHARASRVGERASAVSPDGTLQRVKSVLATVVDISPGADSISEDTLLLDEGIGLNSIEVLSLISAIEEEFQLTIDEGEVSVSQLKTVGSLVTFIEERTSQ